MGRKGLLAIVLLSLFIAFILKFFWLTPYDEHVYLPVEKPVVSSLKMIHPGDQLFIRILKAEDKLELWASANNKPYELYKTWTICAWSGGLGPKHKQGDGKSPEGFYATNKGCLTQTAAIICHLILATRMLTIGQMATPVISLWFTGTAFRRVAMP